MTATGFPKEWLSLQGPQEWHDWLAHNHDQKDQVWLKIKKAHAEGAGILLAEAVEEALCFGWIDGKMYSLDESSFIIRLTPRRPGSVWSLVNRRRAEALVEAGRMTEAGLAVILDAKASGKWQAAYSSKEVPELPDELEQAFRADPAARACFEDWPTGEKAHYLFWIAQAKRADTRQKRITETLERAKAKRDHPREEDDRS
ncbi:YdeI/OmpD-associated family protein [Trichococcus alkaliphilus]|uniref:YdeI/OmpD-associated family protein n=1 Tax=Trichococcus alkaliphilus TaxID=2052943 RepID=UPI000D0ACFA1|nr:YdeI/OmpD-associated family protein [Trichococcus alkaliphilus]